MKRNEFDRFIEKVAIPENNGDCWIWIASTRRKYGHFLRWVNNKRTSAKAHRYSYEYYNKVTKEDMKGFFVCHKCDNPLCVNPKHLFLGTSLDNVKDMVLKGRHSFGRNKNHKWLSKETAIKIRKFKKENPNILNTHISKLFEISKQQVSRILRNEIWKE